jgi:hypothetical protein
MSIDTQILIWLFPIVFMFHDFEEIILGEFWLKKNAGELRLRLSRVFPVFFVDQVSVVFEKSTPELAFSVSLIFALTVLSSSLAAVFHLYGLFLAASSLFFLHGFMHIGQAIVLRKYVPAVISSVVFVVPYGLVLMTRLLWEGIVGLPGLLVYLVIAIVLVIPFILVMHRIGEFFYRMAVKLVVGS